MQLCRYHFYFHWGTIYEIIIDVQMREKLKYLTNVEII